MMIQQFHLDIFQRYHKRGMDAYRKGDLSIARRNLLKAAEMLFKLAGESRGELQRVRKEKANMLSWPFYSMLSSRIVSSICGALIGIIGGTSTILSIGNALGCSDQTGSS